MFKIRSRFYVIYGDGVPIYVGFTSRTVHQRFVEHKRDKDFSDFDEVRVEELKKDELDFDFSWDYDIIENEADEVSKKEAELVKKFGTQDSEFQKADGGGTVWTHIKYFVLSNKDNPRYKKMTGKEIHEYLENRKKEMVILQHFVGGVEYPSKVVLGHFVELIKYPSKIILDHFVGHIEYPNKVILHNFVELIKYPSKIILDSFISRVEYPSKVILKDFINRVEYLSKVILGHFVNHIQYLSKVILDGFINRIQYPSKVILDSFINRIQYLSKVILQGFVGGINYSSKVILKNFVNRVEYSGKVILRNFVGDMKIEKGEINYD